MQDGKPAAPTIAAITESVSGCAATTSREEAPLSTWVGTLTARKRDSRSIACGTLTITAYFGLWRTHCSNITSTLVEAVSAKTSNCVGCRAMTSSVLTPIEPVDPSTVTRRSLVVITIATSWPWEAPVAAHRCDPAPHHDQATNYCCL